VLQSRWRLPVAVAVETLEEISATLRRIEHLGVYSDTRWKV
jgi:hypothetical protein